MKEDMRGLFFIAKGHYEKRGESFFNKVSGETNYLGGYDPEDEETDEWYMLVDTEAFTTLACGSNLEQIVEKVCRYIKKYKTRYKYLEMLNGLEFTEKVSPKHKELMQAVYDTYGYFYEDVVKEQEDLAYSQVDMVNPIFKKTKRLLKKRGALKCEMEQVLNTDIASDKVMSDTTQNTTPETQVDTPKKHKRKLKRLPFSV